MHCKNVFESVLQSGKSTAALLAAATVIFVLLNISVWTGPPVMPSPAGEAPEYNYHSYSAARPHLKKSSYNVIVKKDIFSASRADAAAVAAKTPLNTPSHAAAAKAPRLKLLGTVIVYDGEGALMSQTGQAAEYYRTGDEIDGYKVVEIGRNYVLLSGAAGTVEIGLSDVNKRKPRKTRYI